MFWYYWWVWMVWMIVSGLLVCRLCPPAIVLMPTRTCKNCISEELPVFHHNCTVSSCTLALALHCWHWVTRPLLPRGSIVLVYLARYQTRSDNLTLSLTPTCHLIFNTFGAKPNQFSQDLELWKSCNISYPDSLWLSWWHMNGSTWRLYSQLWGRGVNLSCDWLIPAWCVIAVMTERPR